MENLERTVAWNKFPMAFVVRLSFPSVFTTASSNRKSWSVNFNLHGLIESTCTDSSKHSQPDINWVNRNRLVERSHAMSRDVSSPKILCYLIFPFSSIYQKEMQSLFKTSHPAPVQPQFKSLSREKKTLIHHQLKHQPLWLIEWVYFTDNTALNSWLPNLFARPAKRRHKKGHQSESPFCA